MTTVTRTRNVTRTQTPGSTLVDVPRAIEVMVIGVKLSLSCMTAEELQCATLTLDACQMMMGTINVFAIQVL